MKKICMVAAIACAALMVSCSSKADDKSAVEKKAYDIVKRAAAATARGDYDAWEQIAAEEQAYFMTLTPEQQKEYNKACLEAAQEFSK